jgi:hypothetical protein
MSVAVRIVPVSATVNRDSIVGQTPAVPTLAIAGATHLAPALATVSQVSTVVPTPVVPTSTVGRIPRVPDLVIDDLTPLVRTSAIVDPMRHDLGWEIVVPMPIVRISAIGAIT